MNNFTLDPMGTTVVGENSIANLAQQVQPHGSRAFLVSDPGVQAAGVLDTITTALDTQNIEWTAFTNVDPNPTDNNVNDTFISSLRSSPLGVKATGTMARSLNNSFCFGWANSTREFRT